MARERSRRRDRIHRGDTSPVGKIKHTTQGIEAKGRASDLGFAVTSPESCHIRDSPGGRMGSGGGSGRALRAVPQRGTVKERARDE
jgi:hypothetical protein